MKRVMFNAHKLFTGIAKLFEPKKKKYVKGGKKYIPRPKRSKYEKYWVNQKIPFSEIPKVKELRKTHTLQEIADIYQVSRERIRQICGGRVLNVKKETREKLEEIRKYAKTHTLKEIYDKYHVTAQTLKHHNMEYIVTKKIYEIFDGYDLIGLLETYTYKEVAQMFNVSIGNVQYARDVILGLGKRSGTLSSKKAKGNSNLS